MPPDELDPTVDAELGSVAEKPRPVFLNPPASVPREGPIIGIDLGTTNSCVAIMKKGRPALLRSREGYNTIPSVVALNTRGKLLVGHPARSQMLTNPHRTVYGAKRLVGRPFESATVQTVASRFHYPICEDTSGMAAVRLGEHIVSLEEAQALILAECKEIAQNELGRPVHRAVITVPAYYSDAQRQAVRESARLAGLALERTLNEPTAAALAYGLNRELKKCVLVYDLGGGTFDATAMQIDGNVFEVLATGGDTFLGGVDFDNQIVDWLLTRFEQSTGQSFSGDQIALSRVAAAAEAAKVALSEASNHEVFIPFLMMNSDGKPLDLQADVTRDDIEALTSDLVERTLDVVRDVLIDARLRPSDVQEVLLVGGQSRMPLVRKLIAEMFGREPHPGVHPDEAVGVGAGMLAGSLHQISSVVLVDVLPMTIGIALPGGRFKRVIERNTPLPASKEYTISVGRKDAHSANIAIFQGEDSEVAGNEYLGTLALSLGRRTVEATRLSVRFELSSECILRVSAKDVDTGEEVKTTLATRDTPRETRRRLMKAAGGASASHAKRAEELSQRGGRFWSLLKRVVGG